jgi:hypothetical protein
MPSPESSRRNLAKAKAKWRPPRPWRNTRESQYIRSLVWQWLHRPPEERCSARKLARQLGVSHTWVNTLRHRFARDPEKQAWQDSLWGAATFEQLRDEQERRKWDFVRYRSRRIQRPQRPDPMRDKLERQLKAVLKKQRDWKRDYGHLPYEE